MWIKSNYILILIYKFYLKNLFNKFLKTNTYIFNSLFSSSSSSSRFNIEALIHFSSGKSLTPTISPFNDRFKFYVPIILISNPNLWIETLASFVLFEEIKTFPIKISPFLIY